MDYPLVNGTRHEWSSIEVKVKGAIVIGLKEVAYNDKLEPTKVYGAHAQPLGRTRGVYLAEGSITLLLDEANTLIQALGDGFKETVFDITIAYSEGGATITDEMIGCRVKSVDQSLSQGADGTVRKFDLDVMYIVWNGKQSLQSPLKGLPT
jgi:hypothetical protein